MDIEIHALAKLFPVASDETLDGMTESIRENGLHDPVILYEGRILDGRNRQIACQRAGVKLRTGEYHGKDPLEFVVDVNLRRRQLTNNQRSAVAARSIELFRERAKERLAAGQTAGGAAGGGGRKQLKRRRTLEQQTRPIRATDEAGAAFGVSCSSVVRSLAVLKADPDLFEEIASGKVAPLKAYNQVLARHPKNKAKPKKGAIHNRKPKPDADKKIRLKAREQLQRSAEWIGDVMPGPFTPEEHEAITAVRDYLTERLEGGDHVG